MGLYSWATGDLITATRLNDAYNLLKGVAGGTDTLSLISGTTVDMSGVATTAGFKLPSAAGAVPTADGFLAFDTTTHEIVWGSNGSTRTAMNLGEAQTASGAKTFSGGVAVSGGNIAFAAGQRLVLDDSLTWIDSASVNTARIVVNNGVAVNWSSTQDTQINVDLVVGAPTGSFKGAGTANFAGDIYKNNTAYTNPDYVFEHYYTGTIVKYADKPGASSYAGLRSLVELEAHVREHHCFPGFGQDSGVGLFDGGEQLLLIKEELALHLIDMNKRLAKLELAP